MDKLFDSELKVMEPLWDDGPQTAGTLANVSVRSGIWRLCPLSLRFRLRPCLPSP